MSLLERVQRSFARALHGLLVRVDHTALYPASVVSQNGDGTLELASSVPGRPNLSKVPIGYGVPGVTAKVASGGAVMVGFLDADPSLPYVLIYDQASVTSLSLLGGTMPIARYGDGVAVFLHPQAMYSGSFGNSTLSGLVVSSHTFAGTIDAGQGGALA